MKVNSAEIDEVYYLKNDKYEHNKPGCSSLV
jgi:hypothetical protein